MFLEEDVIKSLPISQQCSEAESKILLTLYDCKRKKYHTPTLSKLSNGKIISTPQEKPANIVTPNSTTCGLLSTPVSISTPNFMKTTNRSSFQIDNKTQDKEEEMQIASDDIAELGNLQNSLDVIVAEAERIYYNCDYHRCAALTEKVLKEDPYHHDCLPIHIACQVELKQSNSK